MDKLLKSLGIDETADAEEIVGKLELKQSEIMERLENVEDEKRKQKLENDLKQINAAIEAFSWMRGKKQTGIAREEDVVSEDFSDLKGQHIEEKKEIKAAKQGNANAQLMSGVKYENSKAVERPKERLYTAKPRKKKKSGIKGILLLVGIIVMIKVIYDYDNRVAVLNDALFSISLVPMSTIQINENCENFLFMINPFGTRSLIIDPAMKKVKIHNGTEKVVLNCEKLKKLVIPDSVTNLSLSNLNNELALTLELPKHLECLSISESIYLTDTGFQALEIPESVQELKIDCDNLENIDISNNLESLTIRGAENLTVNVSGHVQLLYAHNVNGMENFTVNGNVRKVDIGSSDVVGYDGEIHDYVENLTINGDVQELSACAESITVNGQIDKCTLRKISHAEFSEAPRALEMAYQGENELILPEGIETLVMRLADLESLEIPNSVRYLEINSDTLDFDAVKIPEDVLYYKLNSKERNDCREYQAEKSDS